MSMTQPRSTLGWRDKQKDDPDVIRLREHLAANNGIKDLELLNPTDIARAVDLFDRDGFVLVQNILNAEQTAILAAGCDEVIDDILALDAEYSGNRGSHRYSFGGSSLTRSQLHRPAWQMLLEVTAVTDLVSAIFRSERYMLRAASGDFCLPGAVEYQPLHSDVGDWRSDEKSPFSSFYDPRGKVTIRDLPCPYVCVNFMPQDLTPLNGPTRQIPGTQNSRDTIPGLKDEIGRAHV